MRTNGSILMTKIKFVSVCLALSASFLSINSIAANDYSRTISRFGSQAPSTGYFYANEGWSLPCANGVMYIDISTAAGKGMFASIIVTKKTGGSIYWINYTIDANTICYATLIELQ